jgi:ribonuclease G
MSSSLFHKGGVYMSKELIVSITHQETKAAIVENDQVVEIHIERDKEHGIVGAICKGRVTKVLPGMQSAFVDIGLERDAFLYVSDFFEDAEEYDKLVSTAEEQVEKLRQPGPTGLAPASPGGPITSESGATGSRFSDRRPRSRRSRRFRLKGKHFEATPAPTPVPAADAATAPSEPAAAKTSEGETVPPLSLLPGESLARYQGTQLSPSSAAESADEIRTGGEPTDYPLEPEEGDDSDFAFAGEEFSPLQPEEEEAVAEAYAVAPSPSNSGSLSDIPPADAQQRIEEPGTSQAEIPPASAEEPSSQLDRSGAPSSLTGFAGSTEIVEKASAEESLAETVAPPPENISQIVASLESGAKEAFPSFEATGETGTIPSEGPATSAASDKGPLGSEVPETAAGSNPIGPTSKAQFRNAPGTPKFFRRTPDRRRRPTGYEDREENGDSAPAQPLIADLLKEGQEILVQIAKEPLGTKGARITSHIALPGRYLVYMPTVEHIGVSRKIESDDERQRLKRIIQENRRIKFPGGFIVRTAGQGKGEEEFKADINFLYALWAEIRTRADRKRAGSVVHRDLNLVQRILRDQLSAEFTNIRVDNESEYAAIVEFINRFQPSLVCRVKLYTKDTPIFEEFGIQSEIDKALRNKVWLKSGGYIVIDQAEALVAIDVNTGKYVGKSNKLEDTIVKTNIEAAKEIARQIRLRDLGGIIVCDFIDMEDRKNRFKVTQTLEEALRNDKAPSKILQFNDFGLVAITRKRVKQSLMRALCEPCSQCNGAGMVKSAQTICYEIQGEVKKMAKSLDGKEITLRVSPEVGKALKTTEASVVTDMEALLKRDIFVKTDPLLHPERFDIF